MRLKINSIHPEPEKINQAIQTLQAQHPIIYPTDTVYGLGADATQPKAIRKVYKIKGRPLDKPLPIAVYDKKMLEEIAYLTADAKKIITAFLPGPLTLILKKKPIIPPIVTAQTDKIGVRIIPHPVPQKILKKFGKPITTTSANKTGHSPAKTATEAEKQLGTDILILDGGKTMQTAPSTVIDLTLHPPKIVRPGPISKKEIENVTGAVM